jgi:hypothetical protein
VLKRLIALRKHYDLDNVEVPFLLIPQALNLRDPDGTVDRLIALVRGKSQEAAQKPVLIVVDTLNRSFSAGSENVDEDMKQFIVACDRLREETGAAVAVVHHFGKDHARGSRGHSSWPAAINTALEFQRDENSDLGTFIVERQKDGQTGEQFTFRTTSFELGHDIDGDPITSLVVEPAEEQPQAQEPTPRQARKSLGKAAKAAFDVLVDLIGRGDGVVLSGPGNSHIPAGTKLLKLEQWRLELDMRGHLEGKNKRQMWSDRLQGCIQSEVIGVWKDQVWVVGL